MADYPADNKYSQADLHLQNASGPSIEPVRLVKGIEMNYGLYDVKPPKQLFDKIAEIIPDCKSHIMSF